MFKKISGMFLLLMLMACFLTPAFAISQVDLYRYLAPDNAFYSAGTVDFVDPVAADVDKIVDEFQISSTTLIAATTGISMTITAQTDYPRVFTCIVSSQAAGATYVGTLKITGVDSTGITRTETVTISTVSASSNYPFGYVTEVRAYCTSLTGAGDAVDSTMAIDVGVGAKLGLPVDINASTDVHTVLENGAATAATSKANATYNTIDFAADPDGSKDYEVYIRAPYYKLAISEE